jgi:ribonuclease P/MRP protein subunit POP3
MTTQLARLHSHPSNRAKVRSALARKPVFKSVLENPFQISWCVPFQSYGNTRPTIPRPSVPVNVQNVVLARLVAALENISPRHASRKFSRKTESSGHQGNVDITEEVDQTHPSPALDRACSDSLSGASPYLVIGTNAVTKALEFQLRLARKHVVVDSDQLPSRPAPSPIVVVFVCCADVDPTALIDHIPYLVAGCNSSRNATQPIKLVPLPTGSEPTISRILGVRRAAVVAYRRESPLFETVLDTLDSVPIVSAPWLCPSDIQDTPQLVPTHIKQLRTTAPKDMKGAREQRSKARAAAKKNVSSTSRSVRRKPRVTLTTGSESHA